MVKGDFAMKKYISYASLGFVGVAALLALLGLFFADTEKSGIIICKSRCCKFRRSCRAYMMDRRVCISLRY